MHLSARVVLALVLLIFAVPAQTDRFGVSHSCSEPNKSYQFDDEWQLRRFNDDVEDYKRCIEDFVDEQNDAIRNHQNALNEAIDDWNNFVEYELN